MSLRLKWAQRNSGHLPFDAVCAESRLLARLPLDSTRASFYICHSDLDTGSLLHRRNVLCPDLLSTKAQLVIVEFAKSRI